MNKLETVLKDSNNFVKEINQTVSNAQMLYGRPKTTDSKNIHYETVEQVDDQLKNNVEILDIKEDKYPMRGGRSFTYNGKDFNLYVSKDSNGDVSTEVNMSSMPRSTDVNDYKERIYELRNVLATADDLKKKL